MKIIGLLVPSLVLLRVFSTFLSQSKNTQAEVTVQYSTLLWMVVCIYGPVMDWWTVCHWLHLQPGKNSVVKVEGDLQEMSRLAFTLVDLDINQSNWQYIWQLCRSVFQSWNYSLSCPLVSDLKLTIQQMPAWRCCGILSLKPFSEIKTFSRSYHIYSSHIYTASCQNNWLILLTNTTHTVHLCRKSSQVWRCSVGALLQVLCRRTEPVPYCRWS